MASPVVVVLDLDRDLLDGDSVRAGGAGAHLPVLVVPEEAVVEVVPLDYFWGVTLGNSEIRIPLRYVGDDPARKRELTSSCLLGIRLL